MRVITENDPKRRSIHMERWFGILREKGAEGFAYSFLGEDRDFWPFSLPASLEHAKCIGLSPEVLEHFYPEVNPRKRAPFWHGEYVMRHTGWIFRCARCGEIFPHDQAEYMPDLWEQNAALCKSCFRWMRKALRLAKTIGVEINPWEVPA